MIQRIQAVFTQLFDDIILVANDVSAFSGLGMTVVTDIFPDRCSLAGLHSGLCHASHPYICVSACDAPFVSYEIIKFMMGRMEPGIDILVPRSEGGLEPLAAIYSKSCIPKIEKQLENRLYRITSFYESARIREIPERQLRRLDPQMRFTFNVNTPQDLETANLMVQKNRKIV